MPSSRGRADVARIAVTAAWVVIALAFVHLALDSTRPHAVDIHGGLAFAAVLAGAMAVVTWAGPPARVRMLSMAGGAVTVLVAVALILAHAAHETGLALVASGILVVLLSPAIDQPAEPATG